MATDPTWWGPVVAGAYFAGAVGGFGFYIDGKLNDNFRAKVRHKLLRRTQTGEASADDNWSFLFVAIFDMLFDPRRIGRPRFWRSAVATTFVLVVLIAGIGIMMPERAVALSTMNLGTVINYVIAVIFVNIIGDFFSLWETRIIIGKLATTDNYFRKLFYILFDLAATISIFAVVLIIGFSVGIFAYNLLRGPVRLDFLPYIGNEILSSFFSPGFYVQDFIIGGGLFFNYDDGFKITIQAATLWPVYFYTTFFTSVWVWLFIIGGTFWPLFNWLRTVLAVDRYPVGSAMAIGGVFGGLIVTISGYVR